MLQDLRGACGLKKTNETKAQLLHFVYTIHLKDENFTHEIYFKVIYIIISIYHYNQKKNKYRVNDYEGLNKTAALITKALNCHMVLLNHVKPQKNIDFY